MSCDSCHPRSPAYRHICILCQEEQMLSNSMAPLVVGARILKSTVLSSSLKHGPRPVAVTKCREDFLPAYLDCGPCVMSCGHVMHEQCFQKYFDQVVKSEATRRAQ